MPEINEIIKDPKFWGYSQDSQIAILGRVDPNFANLSPEAKQKVIADLSSTSKIDLPEAPPDETGREIARTGGGIAGGLVAGSAGPPGWLAVPAGVALGAAGGDAYYQLLQHAKGDPSAPQTSTDAAKSIGWAGLREGATEFVGGAATRTGMKILAPFAKKMMPEAIATIDRFKGQISPVLMASEATKSRALDILENIGEASILGGGAISKFKTARGDFFEQFASDLVDQFGQRASPSEFGEFFVNAINNKVDVVQRASKVLYNNVDQLAQKAQISTASLKDFAKPLAERAETLKGIEAANAGDDLVKTVMDLPDSIDFKTAQDLRSRFRSRADEFSVINKKAPAIGKAKKLESLTDQEIERALPSDALDAWRDANKFYKDSMDQFQPVMIRKLMKYAEETGVGAESIGKTLFQPGNLTMIKKAKAAMSPAEWEKAQSFYIQRLFKQSLDVNTADIKGTKLLNNMFNKPSGMGKETLEEIFSPEQLKEIKHLATALKLTQERQAEGTGRMLIQLAQGGAIASLGAGMYYDVDALKGSSAAILFGPMIISRMLTNPTVTRLLTKGIQTSPSSPEVFGLLSRLTAAAHRIKLNYDTGESEVPNVEGP